MRLSTILGTCLVIMFSCSANAAQNWTSIQGSEAHTGYVDIHSDPANMRELWSKKIAITYPDDHSRRSARFNTLEGIMVVDGILYATYYEYFYDKKIRDEVYPTSALIAWNVSNGNKAWQVITGNDDMISRPLYDKGRVLIAGYNDNIYLRAYHADSGLQDYSVPMRGYTFDGPLASHGSVYAQAVSYKKLGELSSFNSVTGKLNWIQQTDNTNEHPPILAVSNQYLIQVLWRGIEAREIDTGKLAFTIPLPGHASRNQAGHHYPMINKNNNIVYHVFRDWGVDNGFFTLFAIDLSSRSVKWKQGGLSWVQPTLAGEEVIIVKDVGNGDEQALALVMLNALTGKESWRLAVKEEIDLHRMIVATRDLIFVPCKKKTIAISRKTHQKVWESERAGKLVIGDNKLIIFTWEEKGWRATAIALN